MFVYLLLSFALFINWHSALGQDADGFNIYKDLLRTKPEEPYALYEGGSNPAMYMYHSPAWLVAPNDDTHENKRGVNHFKSFMMAPQREDELADELLGAQKQAEGIYHFPRVVVKRAALVDPLDRAGKPCGWPDNVARLMAKKDNGP